MSRRRGVVRGATVVVLWLLLTACAGEAGAWQPRSRQASIVLWLFWVMLGLAAVVFVLVVVASIFFLLSDQVLRWGVGLVLGLGR